MINLVNLSFAASSFDFEITNNVWFQQNKWKIQYRQSEHISLNFNYDLGEHGQRLTDYPDLLFFHKALTYYALPKLVKKKTTSFHSTEAIFGNIKKVILCFFYTQQLVNKVLIGALVSNQFLKFINDSLILAESLGDNADINRLISSVRFIRHWHEISAKKILPEWSLLKYELEEICPSHKTIEIDRLAEQHKNTWQPLEPNTIKDCHDEAKSYIDDYSSSIIKAHNLIRHRPKNGINGSRTIAQVRKDGKTKHIFSALNALKLPVIDNKGTPLFELPITTKKVKSLGYKCGWQYRTTVYIEEIRPQVINLKRACIFIIDLFTGMRRREISELRAKKAYRKNGTFYLDILRFKTSDEPIMIGKPDSIPVPDIVVRAIDVLYDLFAENRSILQSDYLLVVDIITKKGFEKIKEETISKDIRKFIYDFAGVQGHAHQLRKTIAWLLISRSEANVDLIRQLFGHKSYKMTLRYILRNELMVESIIELIEHNYTEELNDAFIEITEGKTAGPLSQNIKKRNESKRFKGQILVTDIETFVHEALISGMNIFISRIPIGGFCITLSDFTKKIPPCMKRSGSSSPSPQFCDYKNCPHVLHNDETINNIRKQITYYQKKLSYIDDSANEAIVYYYEKEIEDNVLLLSKLEAEHDLFQDDQLSKH